MSKNKHEGITLIALIISIIVLIILAGVSITTLTSENGILTRTVSAKQKKEIAKVQEELQLAIESIKIDYFTNRDEESIGDYIVNHQEELQYALGTSDILVESGSITYKEVEFTVDDNGKITGSEAVEVDNKPEKEETEDYSEWTKLNKISKTGGFDENKGINAPKLGSQLTAVILSEDVESMYDVDGTWYNYKAQETSVDGKTSKWANAVTTDSNGKITGFYVWIPRYAYKITSGYHQSGSDINLEDETKNAGTIEVKFLKGTTNEFADGSGIAETDPKK